MSTQKSERDLLMDISEKLDRVIGLLAIQGREIDKQISTLEELGFDSRTIGELVGLSDSTIRVRKLRRKVPK